MRVEAPIAPVVDDAAGGQRNSRKNARTSSTNSSGCSKAAKWPPRGISFQCLMSLKNGSHHERTGGTISMGNFATPVGTVTGAGCAADPAAIGLNVSQYRRADDVALRAPSATWVIVKVNESLASQRLNVAVS